MLSGPKPNHMDNLPSLYMHRKESMVGSAGTSTAACLKVQTNVLKVQKSVLKVKKSATVLSSLSLYTGAHTFAQVPYFPAYNPHFFPPQINHE